jgi:vacuolar iron transporter family protein
MTRESVHVEPHGSAAIARHYIRDLVYGANDGIITTFAVVAGVTGGALSNMTVLVVGFANIAAEGLSMGAGNVLSIRANEAARDVLGLPEEEASPWRHGIATFMAFVVAGVIPLAPFAVPGVATRQLLWSTILTMASLFGVGAARATVTNDRWWRAGLEMLLLGAVVAAVAYGAGAVVTTALATK